MFIIVKQARLIQGIIMKGAKLRLVLINALVQCKLSVEDKNIRANFIIY